MLGASIISRVRAAAGRFAGANQGNIAVIFAIAAVPVISFVGAAIDYTRVTSARSAMQAALDSTALMLSKDLSEGLVGSDPGQLDAKAADYFGALYKNADAKSVVVHANYTATSNMGSTIEVTGSGAITTDFIRVAGFPEINFNTSATSAWGNTRMRVAMVLDNTGSMDQNNKMPAMQKAAKDMIDTLSGFNKQTGDVYISIIPFAKDVNVGTFNSSSNLNASWINWTEWEAEPPILTPAQKNYPINVKYNNITYTWADIGPGAPCPFDTTGNNRPTNNSSSLKPYGFACMDRPATLSGATDLSQLSTNKFLIPSSGNYAGMICPGLDSGANLPGKTSVFYNGCYTSVANPPVVVSSCTGKPNCGSCTGTGSAKQCLQTTYKHYWRTHPTDTTIAKYAAPGHDTWTGCVNDRDQDTDTKNDAPTTPSTQFYAEQWKDCLPATVTPMSKEWSDLKTQVDHMVPSGNTNQAVGLAWGWQSLDTVNAPIPAPPKDSNYIYKNYIVLLSDGLNTQNRWSTSQSAIDARQKIQCQNIKDDKVNNITIFTIQVNINSRDAKSQVLQDCASGTNNFQMITSETQTAQAFQNILTQISKLRVAR
jgi:Flp pilus assembly protein TadG